MHGRDSISSPDSSASPISHDPLAGTSYRMVMPLGQGGMGEVVEARHVALDRPVVVKLIRHELAAQRELVDRMRLEAQALAGLEHPNIVAVFDFATTPDGRPFLVMERLAGCTLKEEIRRRGKLPWREALDLAGQALAGLAAAHRAGIIHRDVKLDNLFVCSGGYGRRTLKLLDFGIAKVLSGVAQNAPRPLMCPTEQGVTLGSPLFFSPEQALGQAVDCRTDIYAMGIVLYMLLTGDGPFPHARSFGALVRAHADHAPVPLAVQAPSRIASEIDRVVRKALAKNPEHRFGSAAEFAAELIRIEALPAPMQPSATEPIALGVAGSAKALPWDRETTPGWTVRQPVGASLKTVPITVQERAGMGGFGQLVHDHEGGPRPAAFATAPVPRPQAAEERTWKPEISKAKTLPAIGVKRWQLYLLAAATVIALAVLVAILYGLGA